MGNTNDEQHNPDAYSTKMGLSIQRMGEGPPAAGGAEWSVSAETPPAVEYSPVFEGCPSAVACGHAAEGSRAGRRWGEEGGGGMA